MKKGFTLIELMVVIVIIGILAAIAVPKMFGMSAKAKASEVGPAAGTWSKIQASYIIETNSLGDFTSIGYTEPESNNFTYSDPAAGQWLATSKAKLNACEIGGTWAAQFADVSTTTPTTTITGAGCEVLTPAFKDLR